jgi:putative endonuclease
MYHVYILKSLNYNRSYVGVTYDLNDRIEKHNLSRVKSTKVYCPWILVHSEQYSTLSEAKKREWFLKCTPQGGKLKKKILEMAGMAARRA